MTSSASYVYNPEAVEWVDEAFECCEMDPATLRRRHLVSARRSLNLLFSHWEAAGDQTWRIEAQTLPLAAADPDYAAPAGTMAILPDLVFVRRGSFDRDVGVISREDYNQIPDKTAQGMPSSLFFDLATGTIFLWNVPENSTDVLHYTRLRRIQTVLTGAETVDTQKHWFNALAKGLAWQLSYKFKPERTQALKAAHDEAYMLARGADRQRGNVSFGMAKL